MITPPGWWTALLDPDLQPPQPGAAVAVALLLLDLICILDPRWYR